MGSPSAGAEARRISATGGKVRYDPNHPVATMTLHLEKPLHLPIALAKPLDASTPAPPAAEQLSKLVSYVTERGGSAEMLRGWSANTSRHRKGAEFDHPSKTATSGNGRFRSAKAVAEHLVPYPTAEAVEVCEPSAR